MPKRWWGKEGLNFAGLWEAGERKGGGKVRSRKRIQKLEAEGKMYNS